ncbi:uncharacterized protein LOC114355777 [Ostrinia furnacalis]|nr:uncharacterized protein LOC114355777 [Ostrinia furnacalis]
MTDVYDDFPQYAQDPLQQFTQQYKDLFGVESTQIDQKRKKRVSPKNNKRITPKSFVVCNEQKGFKMIQIKVVDLVCERDRANSNSSSSTSDADSECVLLSAQYVVHDAVDEIMDMTECVIKKISKKLTGSNF